MPATTQGNYRRPPRPKKPATANVPAWMQPAYQNQSQVTTNALRDVRDTRGTIRRKRGNTSTPVILQEPDQYLPPKTLDTVYGKKSQKRGRGDRVLIESPNAPKPETQQLPGFLYSTKTPAWLHAFKKFINRNKPGNYIDTFQPGYVPGQDNPLVYPPSTGTAGQMNMTFRNEYPYQAPFYQTPPPPPAYTSPFSTSYGWGSGYGGGGGGGGGSSWDRMPSWMMGLNSWNFGE